LDQAIVTLRQSVTAQPGLENWEGFGNLLFVLYHHPGSDTGMLLEETQKWACRQIAVSPRYLPRRDARPDRNLRVGYLSPFFGTCADVHFIAPLLESHDRRNFEIYCYSADECADEVAERLKRCCDHWSEIRPLDVGGAVELVRRHEIDILVNISLPADQCHKILCSRVAPVQITWLALASCTRGAVAADYRISDPFIDPLGVDGLVYAEKTVRLPDTAWCYDPLVDPPAVKPLPALSTGVVTFGSLNRFCKINPAVVSTWAKILRQLPTARLQIRAIAGSARSALLGQFQELDVEPCRVVFSDRLPREQYLRQYDGIDIMLDTFPYSGHTTVFDSLWMGVPVVTAFGRTPVGRVAASALRNLGLGELVGRTLDDYVTIAVRLANDLPRLNELRSLLRERMQASLLMDAPRFARNIEAAYRQMWRSWCETAAG
jgi:predicted O-linked N-acetylglucosamine transferase (SPINDLY family)